MPPLTRIAGLVVGQGMGTLVEIYADSTNQAVPSALLLIDFGGSSDYAADAVKYIVTKLAAQGTNARFDRVVISHQDHDHLSLLPTLSAAIKAAKITMTIGDAFLGGLLWSAANLKTVKEFLATGGFTLSAKMDPSERTDYGDQLLRANLGYLYQGYGTYLRTLISRFCVPSGGVDFVKNGSSAVMVIENGSHSAVLPGDATWQTMNYINGRYALWKEKKIAPLVPTVWTLEVPHHGALRTAVENYKASVMSDDLDIGHVVLFAKNLNSTWVFASAGWMTNHGHPVQEVLEVFEPYTAPAAAAHTYVAYAFDNKVTPRKARFAVFNSTRGVHTTITALSPVVYDNRFYTMTGAAMTVRTGSVDAELELQRREQAHARDPSQPLEAPPPPVRSDARAAPAPTDEERADADRIAALPRRG